MAFFWSMGILFLERLLLKRPNGKIMQDSVLFMFKMKPKVGRLFLIMFPRAVQVAPHLKDQEETPLLERRISSLLSEYKKAIKQNDWDYAALILEAVVENQMEYCETFGHILKSAESFLTEDTFSLDKPNRREQQFKTYQYRRK